MLWKWYEGEIEEINDLTPKVKEFVLRVLKPKDWDYKPGQFVTWDLPIAEKRLGRWRSYSIANFQREKDRLEFAIAPVPGGSATEFLWNEVEVGQKIRFKGPSGTFVLPEKIDKDIVMICTGTGIGPFRSMLQSFKEMPRSVHLIYGTRHKEGILYEEEMRKYEKKWSKFRYDITLSREEESGSWHHGYVHGVYMEEYEKVRDDIKFYICGWSEMIDEAVANLLVKLGYDTKQVIYELYG